MKTKQITEKMNVHKEWYKQAKKQTLETLPDFINHLMNDYSHDYGTICHAITAGGIATMWAMNERPHGGITGFQAGAIMWEFIRHWNYESNKTGMKLIDYDNLLYPQYEDKFQKTITKDTFSKLRKQAKENIEKYPDAHQIVLIHWQKISKGIVPFGFTITE